MAQTTGRVGVADKRVGERKPPLEEEGRLTAKHLWVRAARAIGLWALIAAAALVPKRAAATAAEAEFETIQEFTAPRHTCNRGIQGEAVAPAAASLVTLGGSVAVAIKREKKRVMEDVADISKDVDRHQSFKDEFLDGHLSDRSIYSGLRKAAHAKEEDEFERNSRMFLEEQRAKKNPKNKKQPKRKESPTVLHRPGDGPEESEDDDDHHPAEQLDEATRLMLERMLGGSEEEPKE